MKYKIKNEKPEEEIKPEESVQADSACQQDTAKLLQEFEEDVVV
jgi:hypothetical protein